MGISPNLLEKSKSYAENLRKKHKKYMTRTQSQPSLIQNCSPNTSNQNSPFSMPNKMKNQQNQRLSFSQLMQKQDQNDSNLFNLESKNQNYTLFQNNQNHINSDQYLKQKNNDKHVIYSSPQQLSRIALQRCSSTLGFQSPQPYRLERPQSSGLRGKKISMNSKYSFIQAFQNNKSQIQNADQRMLTPNKSAINQNYKNQLEQEELNHYTNEQMVLSISKDGSLQVGPISNSQQTQNFNESVSNSQKLIMIGQQNQNVKNSLKQIGLELNKQVQQQKMQKIVVQQRVQSAKYSNNQMNPHQLATQSQIQKELLKNKTQISKIVKGSIVSKLTSVQQNLLNSLQNQNQQNSERKSLGNQLQENSIRKEILTNLQRKVDTRQNSLIKLQQCNKDQIQQQNVNQQIQDYQNEDQSESKFTDKLIISEQQKQSQDFKIKLQKPVQVNSVMQTTSTIKSCLKQGNKSNKNNIQDQIEQEESIDQCKDEYYLLKLIQQREYDSPENYIGFEPEPEEQAQEESKHENDEFTLPNFGMYKSSSFHLNQSSNSQTNSQIECQSSKDVNQLENKTTNEIFKHKKMIYNTDGGSRRKSKLINKQIQEQFNNAECYDQEQITLGQNSNEDLFNVSTVQQNELQCDLQRVKIHRNNEVELNTQTFQKRRSSQGQKLVNILETPKFTFQKM